MADTQTIKGFNINLFESEKVYQDLLKKGMVDENDLNLVEGEEVVDKTVTEKSPNLVTSGAVFEAVEKVKPKAITNLELEALLNTN